MQIAAIYKAEEALKDLTAEERYFRRQREVKPLVEAYFAWVHEQEPETIVSKYTRDGLNYSINQEKYLKVFLEDGNIVLLQLDPSVLLPLCKSPQSAPMPCGQQSHGHIFCLRPLMHSVDTNLWTRTMIISIPHSAGHMPGETTRRR